MNQITVNFSELLDALLEMKQSNPSNISLSIIEPVDDLPASLGLVADCGEYGVEEFIDQIEE